MLLLLIFGLPLASWLAFSRWPWKVFRRSRRNPARRLTPDGLGLLRAHCNRPAQPDRTGICRDDRARPALFIPRASYRLGPLQSAICSAALYSRNFDGRPTSD
jgi:hypothetical protein